MVDYLSVAFTWIGFIFTELLKFVVQIFNAISFNTVPLLLGAFTLYTIGRVLLRPFLGAVGSAGSDQVRKYNKKVDRQIQRQARNSSRSESRRS